MSFDFDAVYVMQLAHGDSYPQIVLAVQEVEVEGVPAIKFWRTSGQYPFRLIRGRVIETTDNLIEFVATAKYTFDFVPLTLERWHQLGRAGYLLGYKHLKDRFQDDADVVKFYRDEFFPEGHIKDVPEQT